MNRVEAYALLKEYLHSENLLNHSLAVEAIMRGLAEHLHEDVDKFGITGLLHDIDYEFTADNPEKHSLVAEQMLTEKGLDPEMVYAIKVHNEIHGLERITILDKALYAADPVSGFITAAAMVRPEKKLEPVQLKSLKKRFKESAFARGASREQMQTCSELGLTLEDYLTIALTSMQKIADDIGL